MNPQDRTALAIAATLAASGVRHVVASPGSRHTPLLLALDNHPDLSVSVHHDERSAGFVALGIGKATGIPAVLVCTSGSAVSHYFPAVVEADLATTPMIIVSADRPHELWGRGAPQTINQREIFGSTVRAYSSIDPDRVGETTNTNLASWLMSHWRFAVSPTPGPVHLNVELREPLLPADSGAIDDVAPSPIDSVVSNAIEPTDGTGLVSALQTCERPLLVAGRLTQEDSRAVQAFAEYLGAPVFADPQSGLRSPKDTNTIRYADVLAGAGVLDHSAPDLVLRCGPIPTSKPIWTWLGNHPEVPQYVITASGIHDPMGSAAVVVTSPIAATLTATQTRLSRPSRDFVTTWAHHDQLAAAVLDGELRTAAITEPAIAATVAATCTAADSLVVASSMPIRDLDSWGSQWNAKRTIANRGANGIDGTVSTAIGVAMVTDGHTVLYMGDTAALHDIGALATVARLVPDLTILVVNNNGGGIFHHLAQGDPSTLDSDQFERLYGAPHGLSFASTASAFGVNSVTVVSMADLSEALSLRTGTPLLIEVNTTRAAAAAERERLRGLVRATLT
ncbi:MAG: 2-succinyl-5-enolpyruvyl-6-hydroxy-3-cyclohexene-1-carboxylic-acid synthase [Actinobacteria bacterium]|nr:2-succinyl-5-enolpyruvyl-6-hydroxy-3-cyclohexene-1-carboxylic-acid synthase [Actinomycetota bacterium]